MSFYDDSVICPIMSRRFFQSIIAQAALDSVAEFTEEIPKKRPAEAVSEFKKRVGRHKSVRKAFFEEREEAREFLLGGIGDYEASYFRMICFHAGYNPDDVVERAQKLALRQGWADCSDDDE
jgi:hypothetical protein